MTFKDVNRWERIGERIYFFVDGREDSQGIEITQAVDSIGIQLLVDAYLASVAKLAPEGIGIDAIEAQ